MESQTIDITIFFLEKLRINIFMLLVAIIVLINTIVCKDKKIINVIPRKVYLVIVSIILLFFLKQSILFSLDYSNLKTQNYITITGIVDNVEKQYGSDSKVIVHIENKKIFFKIKGTEIYPGYKYKLHYLPYSKLGAKYEPLEEGIKEDYYYRTFELPARKALQGINEDINNSE